MRLSKHALVRFRDVHTVAGIAVSLALYVVFVTGALVVFRHEIEVWQDPRLHPTSSPCVEVPLSRVVASALGAVSIEPESVHLSGLETACGASEVYLLARDGRDARVLIDRRTGDVLPQRSQLARFVTDVHFFYEPRVLGVVGPYLAGLVGVIAMLTIVTGTLVHLRDFARQFDRVRAEHGERVLWSDLHKVTGSVGLPFQLAMCFTGALLCLSGPLLGWLERHGAAATFGDASTEPAPDARSLLDVDARFARARAAEPTLVPHFVVLRDLDTARSELELGGLVPGTPRTSARVRVRGDDGASPSTWRAGDAALDRAMSWVHGLHFAWFGGVGVRFVYAGLALAGCATIVSGNGFWLARRDPRRARRSTRAFARATLAVSLGIVLAVATMALTNRVVPVTFAGRVDAEAAGFGLGALVAALVAWRARSEASAGWVLLSACASVLGLTAAIGLHGCGAQVVAALAGRAAWGPSGLDVAMLVASTGLGLGALALRAPRSVVATSLARGGSR